MAQMTQDLAHEALRACSYNQHPALTVNETEQLLRAWLQREVLRAERDQPEPGTAARESRSAASRRCPSSRAHGRVQRAATRCCTRLR